MASDFNHFLRHLGNGSGFGTKPFQPLISDTPFYMHTESAAKVNDPNKERVLTAMYQFYYQHRHPYSHASADDFDTVIIEDRKVADELFNEVIQSMKAGFTELQ